MLIESRTKRGARWKGSVCLHASSVNVSGKALVFLGHSTAGKSTISKLLSERYPVIADDKVWIFQRNGFWMVYNGSKNFYILKKRANLFTHQKKYQLLAILRIFKSKKTKFAPISPKQTCKYLVDAIFEVDRQRREADLKTKKKWFKMAAMISRQNGGWRLTFAKDKSTIKKVHDVFG